jgi:hypothetical protein
VEELWTELDLVEDDEPLEGAERLPGRFEAGEVERVFEVEIRLGTGSPGPARRPSARPVFTLPTWRFTKG